jgi:hypothetical protein
MAGTGEHGEPAGEAKESIKYPTNHVVGIIVAPAVEHALNELRSAGFRDSELHVQQGEETADRVAASSGHSGMLGAILRIADRLGIREDELEEKHTYEEALRAGDAVILVHAPTPERKDLAGDILKANGAHFINFLGRFTSERIKP